MTSALLQAWEAHGGFPPNRSISIWCRRLEELGSALLPIKVGDGLFLASVAHSLAEWRVLHCVVREAFTQEMLDLGGRHDPDAVPGELREALESAGVKAWRLHAIKNDTAVRQSYKALNDVEIRRSSLEGAIVKSTGQVIRRFRSAVDAGDDGAAGQWLGVLSSMHSVEQHNLAFLALWREARLRPAFVHASEAMGNVAKLHERMPFELREMVGRVVLEYAVRPWVEVHDAQRVAEIVGHSEGLVSVALIEQCCTLSTSVGAAFRMLSSVTNEGGGVGPADWDLIANEFSWLTPNDEIVALPANDEALESLANNAWEAGGLFNPATVVVSPDRKIRELAGRIGSLDENDIHLLLLYRGQGYEGADEVLRQWWVSLDIAAKPEKRAIAPFFDSLAAEVESGTESPNCWLALLSSESEAGEFCFGELPLVADESDSEAWGGLVEKLNSLDEHRFLDYLPSLTRSWAASSNHSGVAKALIDNVYVCLLVDENVLAPRVDMLNQFLGVALVRGFTAMQYGEHLKQLGEIVRDVYSVRLLEQLIDTQELLVDSECPDRGALEDLLRCFQAAAQRHCTRMDRAALDVLCELLVYRGLSAESAALLQALPPDDGYSSDHAANPCPVRGRNVLIYTLDTPSGERAKRIIEGRYGALVRTDNSKQASQALKGSLEWAYLVICVTRAAQHAATGVIDRFTPRERLLRPEGKGSSSILRKLGEWAQDSDMYL